MSRYFLFSNTLKFSLVYIFCGRHFPQLNRVPPQGCACVLHTHTRVCVRANTQNHTHVHSQTSCQRRVSLFKPTPRRRRHTHHTLLESSCPARCRLIPSTTVPPPVPSLITVAGGGAAATATRTRPAAITAITRRLPQILKKVSALVHLLGKDDM